MSYSYIVAMFVYVGISSASSFVEMVIVGRMRNYGYGSMPMEKSFRVS